MKKINKVKEGITIRFSARLPREQHEWLKQYSNKSKETDQFISMNELLSKAVEYYRLEVI